MTNFGKYIGLDIHKETIAVGVADGAGGEPRYWGEIKNPPEAVRRLLARLGGPDERLRFCYEAGPRRHLLDQRPERWTQTHRKCLYIMNRRMIDP